MNPTHWFLIVLSIALIAFDIYAAAAPRLPTISEVVWSWLRRHPVVAFAGGVLAGHLFW